MVIKTVIMNSLIKWFMGKNNFCMLIIILFLIFSCSKHKGKTNSNNHSIKLEDLIKKHEGIDSIKYINLRSFNGKCSIIGYSFVKNDTLYLINIDTLALKYIKYPNYIYD
jgi:hypothetical protein